MGAAGAPDQTAECLVKEVLVSGLSQRTTCRSMGASWRGANRDNRSENCYGLRDLLPRVGKPFSILACSDESERCERSKGSAVCRRSRSWLSETSLRRWCTRCKIERPTSSAADRRPFSCPYPLPPIPPHDARRGICETLTTFMRPIDPLILAGLSHDRVI